MIYGLSFITNIILFFTSFITFIVIYYNNNQRCVAKHQCLKSLFLTGLLSLHKKAAAQHVNLKILDLDWIVNK